ncbi:MAG: RNA methyltransferase [Polyangiaceae bacterium]|nr:RNA methyltransferase [Polyangiaceae bacterium]
MREPCPHAERCTGCPLIALDYAAQLEHKSRTVARAFARYPSLDGATLAPVAPAEPIMGYRVRAKLVVGAGGAIGLFAGPEHEVLDIPGCRVLTPAVASAVAALRRLVRDPPTGSGATLRPRADGGALTAIDVREARADQVRLLVSLVVDARRVGSEHEVRAAAEAIVQAEPRVSSVALSLHSAGPRVLGAPPRVVVGERDAIDEVGGVAHFAAPGAFVQTHRGQAAKLHQAIAHGLEVVLGSLAGQRVFDVYGGSGAIGLALAKAGARVTLVESYAPAARLAARAGLEVVADDAALLPGRADAIVVDPPRRGLSARARSAVARAAPRAIAYVSCNPETLARDLDAFAVLGFTTLRVEPFDMIPLSDQVEALAVLQPAPRPAPDVLFENDDLVIVDKPAHEPTLPQGEHAGSLRERVRRLPGCSHAEPLIRLDLESSGVAVFAKSGEAVSRWQPAIPAASERYLAVVRGITRGKGAVNRPLLEAGRERPAHTRYRRLEVAGGHSLLEIEPREGQKHQIRRHLAGLGHPVVGDTRYGHAPTNRHFEEKHGLDRQLLHLSRLELATPGGDGPIVVSSPLPPACIAVLQCVGFRAFPGHDEKP